MIQSKFNKNSVLLGAEQEATFEDIQNASLKAVLASMKIVRDYQLGLKDIGASEVKVADSSLVTEVDRKSEEVARAILADSLPQVSILGEEAGGDIDQENHLLMTTMAR